MSYYFYDLETSGLDAKWARIMQFAGVTTDDDFNPIGEPDDWLVKMTPDILPDPYAIMVTGITPQKTLEEGCTEAELLQKVTKAFKRNITVLGFNSIRFDDEFMRYTYYRNFYDPYEREWADGRSRWDIIDLVRMTRALRPEGIVWPVTEEGKPTNRLELLSKENGLEHRNAHDALSDVYATISVMKLMKEKQPKLFEHLLSLKGKRQVAAFLGKHEGQPVIHTSGMFPPDHLSTSAIVVLGPHPSNGNAVLVYDLRYPPSQFKDISVEEITRLAFTPYKQLKEGEVRLPVKAVHLNKAPALAPLGVLNEESQNRINLTIAQIKTNLADLAKMGDFKDKITAAWEANEFEDMPDVDTQLYGGGFMSDPDKRLAQQVRNRSVDQLADFHPNFTDDRMEELLLRYKGRNFPKALSQDEQVAWEKFRASRLSDTKYAPLNMKKFMNRIDKMTKETDDKNKLYLLEELKLYAESIAPYETEELL